ncbi:MAG: hypothetical protein LBK94_05020 [Prevotellaceae bacterium]|jgi:hypothetical protein|nr:hypothetical protein [Prevotellaceae bacterium]
MELLKFVVNFSTQKLEMTAGFKKSDVWRYIEANFPEALQNFTDRICEAQRDNCKTIYQQFADNYIEGGYNYDLYLTIRDCEQPKIEEL